MASRKELLDSIQTDMKLTKSFFMKIYGYELTWPGFAEVALSKLEKAGCSQARNYYTCIVIEYDHNHEKEMKGVAEWYAKQDFTKKGEDKDWKRQQETELLKRKKELLLMKKSQKLTGSLQS